MKTLKEVFTLYIPLFVMVLCLTGTMMINSLPLAQRHGVEIAPLMADGTDPMPLCRHVDSHGNPCVLPPAAKPLTEVSLAVSPFDQKTQGSCRKDVNGCTVCQIASQGPIVVCPPSMKGRVNIDSLGL